MTIKAAHNERGRGEWWMLAALILLLLAFFAVVAAMVLIPADADARTRWMQAALLLAGILLVIVTILYAGQFAKIRRISAQNARALGILENRMSAAQLAAQDLEHGLNNILAAIRGNAGFLAEDLAATTPQWQYARNIQIAEEQAQAMTVTLVQRVRGDGMRENAAWLPPASLSPYNAPRKTAVTLPERRSSRLLLVDDQPDVLAMTAVMLERSGFTVECCAGGAPALEKILRDAQAYDLVVSDQRMAEMSGTALARQAGIVAPDLPFILLSGYKIDELSAGLRADTATMASGGGVKAVLRKPVAWPELLETIRRILAGGASAAPR